MTSEPEHNLEKHAASDEEDDEILSMRFGGKTIGENLEAAIAAGRVIRQPDGKLSVPQTPPVAQFNNAKPFAPDCSFLNRFMFEEDLWQGLRPHRLRHLLQGQGRAANDASIDGGQGDCGRLRLPRKERPGGRPSRQSVALCFDLLRYRSRSGPRGV